MGMTNHCEFGNHTAKGEMRFWWILGRRTSVCKTCFDAEMEYRKKANEVELPPMKWGGRGTVGYNKNIGQFSIFDFSALEGSNDTEKPGSGNQDEPGRDSVPSS